MKFDSESKVTQVLLQPDWEKTPKEEEPQSQYGSISGAVFNISTTTIGAGIMAIPATMKVVGIIPGFMAIVLVAFLSDITTEFMVRYTTSGESTTYAGMVGESFGPLGSLAVKMCIILTTLGVLIIDLIILGMFFTSNLISKNNPQNFIIIFLHIVSLWLVQCKTGTIYTRRSCAFEREAVKSKNNICDTFIL
ncbi:putative amino acid transporter, transmembrane domain-containing protein [Lupinus albus]|uniref:Putative amino acid transporter, transmembrane domain-containing protein n=1 Tax=Lupinus albus TaxID=3870 RepID=A0A6A4PXE0_LUPAL|nr:putative amino acid transporter, transmembrane domain-containing protein [Lupinus albus]